MGGSGGGGSGSSYYDVVIIAEDDVPYGRIEYDLNEGNFMAILRCPGTLTADQMAACVPGEKVTCESDGCTITGTCERVCCNSCGSSVFLNGCKASATPD